MGDHPNFVSVHNPPWGPPMKSQDEDAKEVLAARFWAKVDKRGPDECWLWSGSGTKGGYGQLVVARKTWLAHRLSVVLSGREIPDGMQIDHMCRTRWCVNPSHLRIVTLRQNVTENSASVTVVNSQKTHCLRGHALVPGNLLRDTGVRKGWRCCRLCHHLRARKYREARRARNG